MSDGVGGIPGGLGGLLEQAKGLQERMNQMREEAGNKTVEGSAGGGMVTVVANGRMEVVSVRIEESLVKTQDRQMIEDLVTAATNVALANARNLMTDEMSKLTGGLSIPGLF